MSISHRLLREKTEPPEDQCSYALAQEIKDDDDEVVFEENDAYVPVRGYSKEGPDIFVENDAYEGS